MVQARAAGGQVKLHDGGSRLAARVASLQASLQSHVSQLRALLPGSTGSAKQPQTNGPAENSPAENTLAASGGCTQDVPAQPVPAPQHKPATPVKSAPSSKVLPVNALLMLQLAYLGCTCMSRAIASTGDLVMC